MTKEHDVLWEKVTFDGEPMEQAIVAVELHSGTAKNSDGSYSLMWDIGVAWLERAGTRWLTYSESWYFADYECAAQFMEMVGDNETIGNDWYARLAKEADF